MKRSITILLALLLILTLVPVSAFAAKNVQISVPAEYSIDGKTSYDLTQAEYDKLLKKVHDSIQSELDEMCRGFFHYESMTVNDDCTGFTIVVNDVMQTEAELAAESLMYEMRAQYAAYSGVKADGVRIFYDNMVGDTLWSKDVGEPDPLVLKSAPDESAFSSFSGSSANTSRPTSTPKPTPKATPKPVQTPTPVTAAKSERMVWIPTNGGKKYHANSSCSGMKNPAKVTISEAISRGFDPCKKCKP